MPSAICSIFGKFFLRYRFSAEKSAMFNKPKTSSGPLVSNSVFWRSSYRKLFAHTADPAGIQICFQRNFRFKKIPTKDNEWLFLKSSLQLNIFVPHKPFLAFPTFYIHGDQGVLRREFFGGVGRNTKSNWVVREVGWSFESRPRTWSRVQPS